MFINKSFLNKIFYLILFLPVFIYAQDINKMVVEEKSGKPIIVGLCDRSAFADSNFAWWYNSEYNNYEPNKSELDSISNSLANIKIKIVFGTWCSDSRREVPRFLKILDDLKFNGKNLEMICVDRDKKAEGTEVDTLDIKLVPTFIIYRDAKEIGRILETPQITLEADLNKLIK